MNNSVIIDGGRSPIGLKNGKLLGHTDNYIQIQMEGGADLINSIHSVKLVDNHGIVVDGKLS